MEITLGILIPFLGTIVGSSLVFFLKKNLSTLAEKILLGFAAGVMMAASIWSLLIPSINMSTNLDKLSFLPATIGFLLGIFFLLILDTCIPHLHVVSNEEEGIKSNFKRSTMLFLSIAMHNIPEGIAIGVILSGVYYGNTMLTISGAIAFSIGIAIQNIPEAAIVSMPLKSLGFSKYKSFSHGILAGIIEPIFSIITIFMINYITSIMPYILSFAAGAMIYVVVEELIPQSQTGKHSNISTISIAFGFVLMMILDIAFG